MQDERDALESELSGLSIGNYSRLREMTDRTEQLKSAREEKRKNLAQEKLYEHWEKNNPELRALDSDLHREHVRESWNYQIVDKLEEKRGKKEDERQFANEYEEARVRAIENLRKKEEERKRSELERAEILKQQMEELKEREKEAEVLKQEEMELFHDQLELEKLEAERKGLERRREQKELKRFLHHQYKAQMRRRAQEIQEELEVDKQILERLLQEELQQKKIDSARQEKARQDAEWMKQVLEEQMKLEQEREAELDMLYREEARQVWEKREEEWSKEREARKKLMQEVLGERSSQIADRMAENRVKQDRLLQDREDLLKHLENVQKTSRQEKRYREEMKTKRKEELVGQLTERQEKDTSVRRLELEELKNEEEAEREYGRVVRMEAQRRREMGYRPRSHGRRRTAWE